MKEGVLAVVFWTVAVTVFFFLFISMIVKGLEQPSSYTQTIQTITSTVCAPPRRYP